MATIETLGVPTHRVSRSTQQKFMAQMRTTEFWLGEIHQNLELLDSFIDSMENLEDGLFLVLRDRIQDPRNFGGLSEG